MRAGPYLFYLSLCPQCQEQEPGMQLVLNKYLFNEWIFRCNLLRLRVVRTEPNSDGVGNINTKNLIYFFLSDIYIYTYKLL